MSKGQLIVASLVLFALAFVVPAACGGHIDYGPDGTLNDGGVFRLPDGAVLFAPGSTCEHYDAANYLAITGSAPVCSDSAACTAWVADSGLAFGFTPTGNCIAGVCKFLGWRVDDPLNECAPGAQGDAYCDALYQQFAVGDVQASYFCEKDSHSCFGQCEPANVVEAADGGLVFQDDAASYLLTFSVRDGMGGSTCHLVCAP